jgi:protein involved in polysaccharide export with SLBB domain
MFLLPCSEPSRAQEKQHSITPPTTEYRIQVGDIIKLDVWKEPEITRTIPVDRKGYIHLPLLHDVKAAGLTAMELAGSIRNKLDGKIPNPQVTVTIIEFRNPYTVPPQLEPKTPVHPQESPSPDLRQACCVA